nr:hypothetical protein [Anaerolineales bacterium]
MIKHDVSLFHRRGWRPVIGGAIGVAILIIFTALNLGGKSALWENAHWTLATWIMVAIGWMGWQQAEGKARLVRGWMLAGLLNYGMGQLLWGVHWGLGASGFPTLANFFHLALGPCLVVAFSLNVRGQLSRGDEIALFLDAGMIFLGCTTAIALLYIPHTSLGIGQTAVLIAYPSFFFATTGAGLVAGLKAHARLTLNSPYLLVGGLAFSGVCWTLWNGMFLRGEVSVGTWVGYGFSVAYLLVGLGVAVWSLEPSQNPKTLLWARQLLRALPILAIPLAVFTLIWNRSQDNFLNQWINLGSIGVITLALLRQSLLFWERDWLYMG